ncbi:UDP-N-acetyl-D-mannosamine dehydrogenase [Bdellovibrio sp. HCB288]|uniref:UDP-N-acetyl-D-mannosamine dehydrogenase n=1 Tax=Bdellovibrio sp. HCB288 TaxID=3394355 RepID=UPI0039B4E5D2
MISGQIRKVCVVGLGYIGLPTAAVLASRGVEVIGLEVNETVIETINKGDIHIVEPGLDVIVKLAVSTKKLRATKEATPADVFLIAVPTPFKGDHKPDLQYVESATRAIAKVLKRGDLVVLESTSPVGTTEQIAAWLAEERGDLSFAKEGEEHCDVYIAYCPERVLPGQVLRELIENSRVIGGVNLSSAKSAQKFYQIFVQGDCVITSARLAEMTKLAENSFRDVNIAFANELSLLCDQFGINVWELVALANRHPRVNILQPGCGVGGHCIAVDPWFLVSAAPEKARVIRTAREVNNYKQEWVVKQIQNAAKDFFVQHGRGANIVCYGLAFKPNIDDLRESPALEVYHDLRELGLPVSAVEPNISEHNNVMLVDLERSIEQADILVFLVKHKEFAGIEVPHGKVALDFCGVHAISSPK